VPRRLEKEEVETRARPSLAEGLRGTEFAPARRGAAVVGLALRFALSAPPFGLRRASLRPRPTT